MKLIRKMKYRHKIAIVIFFILLPFLVLSLFFVKKSWDERVDGILSENRADLQSGADALSELLGAGMLKLTYITNNRMIAAFLDMGDFSDLVRNMTVYDNIKEIVDALVLGSTDIRFNIYPVSKNAYNGKYIEKLERLAGQLGEAGVAALLQSNETDAGVWMYHPDEGAGNGLGYITCYKKMQYFSTSQTLAITEMRIRLNNVFEGLSGKLPQGTIIAYQPDEEHRIMLQLAEMAGAKVWQRIPEEQAVDFNSYQPISIRLTSGPGTITEYLPRAYVQKAMGGYLLITIVSVTAAMLLLFFIVEFAAMLLTKRITKLVDRVNENVENTTSPFDTGKYTVEDDLGQIEAKFNEMLEKIHTNYLNSLEYENEKKMLELEILQSKINPHFLYNTLSTMRWNCKNETMAQTIDSMVQYYRLSLNKGQSIVTISHELKLLEEYLKVLKYTYSSDFAAVFDVDDTVKDAWIVKHLLQPIVENSILHGINGLENGGGVIRLTGRQKDGIITLTIADNGVGMPEETLRQLMSGAYAGKVGGYGLQSIQKRIALFYGSVYSMDIVSELGRGTTVTITFPAVQPENCAD